MNTEKKVLFKNTFSLYIMNFAKLIFPLFTLPYLTRVLSTESYGVVTYVKAFVTYIQLVLDFGFLLSATKEIVLVKNDNNKIGRILGDTIVEKLLLGIIASIFYIISIVVVPIMRNHYLFSFLYLISSLLTIFIFDFMYRGIEKMHLVSLPFTVSKSIVTILTLCIVKGDNDLLLLPVLEIVGNGVSVLFSLFFVKNLKINISFSKQKKWLTDLKTSGIYFISNFATTVFGALTTLIAGFYLSLSDIAAWGICMQILSAAKSLYNPIANSLYPHMIKEKDIKLIHRINKFMFIPMFLGIIVVIFGAESVMNIIGGNKYIIAGNALRALLPAFVFSFYSMIYGWPVLGAIGMVKETSTTTVIASIVQILALILLIILNSFTLLGIAVCCSLSETALLFIRYFIYYKHRKLFKIEEV